MTLAGRCVPPILLAVAFSAAAPVPAHAQLVVAETETLDFNRPESWGMKYYASLALIPNARLTRPLAWLAVLAAAAGRLEAQPEAYAVDPAVSRVRIHLGRTGLLKFLGHDHDIEAPLADGRIEVVDGDPTRSSVVLRFESARLSVVPGSEPAKDIPKVEERMRGPEVLEVAARYPEIAFVSTSVRRQTRDGSGLRIVVAGTLTLRGRSLPVEVPLEVVRETFAIEARGGLDLTLRDLGIEPPSVAGVVKVANRFRLEFEIRATAAAPP